MVFIAASSAWRASATGQLFAGFHASIAGAIVDRVTLHSRRVNGYTHVAQLQLCAVVAKLLSEVMRCFRRDRSVSAMLMLLNALL
jgi:hypothetical protein